jgi:uncharacterized membrane protein YgdD (TMEM256/DUF423 family)
MTPPASPNASPDLNWGTKLAAVLGALAVAAGAFGAHGLKARVSPADLEIWRTGAHYHLIHALVMLVVSLAPGSTHKARARSCGLFAFGIFVFAGTLYGMVLGGPRWLGAITPIGGGSLILGWLSLLARPR